MKTEICPRALARERLWPFLIMLSVAVGSAQTASFVANCESIGLGNFTGTIPGIGAVINYVTTYDGRRDRKPLTQDLGGGEFYISQELRPHAGQPGVYEADYLSYTISGNLDEYGSFTVNLPTADADGNGLPDFAQKDKIGTTSFTGNGQADWPSSFVFPFGGQLTRTAGSASGSYSLMLNGSAGTIHYTGNLCLLQVWGSVSYTRGDPSVMAFDLTRTDQRGVTTTLTGSSTFTVVTPDQVALPHFFLTSSDNKTYVVKPSTLSRTGKRYIGPVELVDGTLETSWPDYLHWVVEITDENDANGNYISDLTDLGLQPLSIVRQPQSQAVLVGEVVTFDVLASGTPPLTYQWFVNRIPIPSANSRSLTLLNVQLADTGSYTVVVSNAAEVATSASAVLTVNEVATPPTIVRQPQGRMINEEEQVTFMVEAIGAAPLVYLWEFEGGGISAASNGSCTPILKLSGLRPSHSGNYTVTVSNRFGSVVSEKAMLSVVPNPMPSDILWMKQKLDGAISSLALSSDGRTVAYSDNNGVVLWNIPGRTLKCIIRGIGGSVWPLSFAEDNHILVGGVTGRILIWRVSDGTLLNSLGDKFISYGMFAVSRDGNVLAAVSYNSGVITLWRVSDLVRIRSLVAPDSVASLALCPDGSLVVSCGNDKALNLWRVADGKRLWRIDGYATTFDSVAFSPDGKLLAVYPAQNTGDIQLIDVADGSVVRTIPCANIGGHSGPSMVFSPDGNVLFGINKIGAYLNWGFVSTWKVADGELVMTTYGTTAITALAVSSNILITAEYWQDKVSHAIRLWSVPDGECLGSLTLGSHYGSGGIAFSPDDDCIASWDAVWPSELKTWKVQNAAVESLLTNQVTSRAERYVAFSPDGSLLVAASEGGLIVLSFPQGQYVFSVSNNFLPRFSRNGKTLASVGRSGAIYLWDVKNWSLQTTLPGDSGLGSIAFSKDGMYLACSSYSSVKLWRVTDASLVRTLTLHEGPVNEVAFSPTEDILASGGYDGTIKFVRVPDGVLLRSFNFEAGHVGCIAFTPDGEKLLAAWNQFVEFRRVSDGALLHSFQLPGNFVNVNQIAVSPSGRYCGFSGDLLAVARMPLGPGAGPRLLLTHQLSGSLFQMDIEASIGSSLEIQASTDLRVWNTFTNMLSTSATTRIVDPEAARFPIRFYRAVAK